MVAASAQSNDAFPAPFLVILVVWLAVIFTSFELFVRPNRIAIVTFSSVDCRSPVQFFWSWKWVSLFPVWCRFPVRRRATRSHHLVP